MRHFSRLALSVGALAVALGLSACDSGSSDPFDITDFTGNAYTGQVTIDLDRPDGTGSEVTYNGTAQFTSATAGTVTLTIDVDAPNAEPITFAGTYTDDGMRFTLPGTTTTFTVRDGNVDGSGQIDFFSTTLDVDASGRLTRSTIDTDFDVEIVDGGTADAPDGTTAVVEIDMSR